MIRLFIICQCTYEQGLLSVHCLLVFWYIPNGLNRTSEYYLTQCGIKKYSPALAATSADAARSIGREQAPKAFSQSKRTL